MPPRRGARRGGRGGRGRGAGRVQPEVQPVAQAPDPAAPVTHADLAAMEQRFRDMIMQMREQQKPASPTPAPAPARVPAPAPAPVPVAPQFVPDQLSAEAKHLRDFRKYNPTTFDGSLEDPTRAQMWLSSLETIFRYMKCPEDRGTERRPDFVPTGAHVARVRERGSSWVPLFGTLMGSEGKGRGKLANDKEGSVTCHMGT
ncbi:gag protease polyprotein [Cucumis melo var. makuwa]|uniref:Gag protease polyprotein n=1 Tax=Cucumis melo var. makuwa TaxID=1194695 RepID=A0A5A7SVV6_CUCMM|nr:gag protease polyprotein [Cucumis melo var. makuwa]